MNVLFLTSTLPRFHNDSQAPFVFEQASAWKEARPEDQIYILAPGDHQAPKKEQLNNISIIRFTYWWPTRWQQLAYPAIFPNIKKNPLLLFQLPFFLIFQYWNISKAIRKHKIALIYAHWVMPQGLVSYLIKKTHNIPYVLQNHSSDLRIFHKMGYFGRKLARAIILNSKFLFCVNPILKGEALDFFKQEDHSKVSNKIAVLPMGVYNILKSSSLANGQPLYDFGFIGRLTNKKGIDHFINALLELKKQGIPFKAAIAGDGEEKDRLVKTAQGADINFLGNISGDAKTDFFSNSRTCVFPSIPSKGDVEGLPVAVLEALCFGKLIISSRATNIDLLPEWDQIKNGILLLDDPTDVGEFSGKLKQALSFHKENSGAKIDAVQRAAGKYLWEHLIQNYIQAIQNVYPNL